MTENAETDIIPEQEWEALKEENEALKEETLGLEEDLKKAESQLEVLENFCFGLEQEHAEAHQQLQQQSIELSERTEELQRIFQELENQHRQLQETQAQLVQAEKMAGLGTLVAGVAHEINNPTNFIVLGTHSLKTEINEFEKFLMGLLEGSDPDLCRHIEQCFERFSHAINNIGEGGNRIKTIVKDLRTFSRLDEAERKSVNLVENLQTTLHLIQTQYKKDVEFVCDFQSQEELECWPAQLNQVFMNLMVNACHAIQSKQEKTGDSTPGVLTLRTLHRDNWLLIQFQDTGCGMTEEVRKRVFEPFFTTKPVGDGTGLGMSVSYSIIEKHEGRIEVESQVSLGTTITIWLPLTKADSSVSL